MQENGGWEQRGKRFSSPSGHGFLAGRLSDLFTTCAASAARSTTKVVSFIMADDPRLEPQISTETKILYKIRCVWCISPPEQPLGSLKGDIFSSERGLYNQRRPFLPHSKASGAQLPATKSPKRPASSPFPVACCKASAGQNEICKATEADSIALKHCHAVLTGRNPQISRRLGFSKQRPHVHLPAKGLREVYGRRSRPFVLRT